MFKSDNFGAILFVSFSYKKLLQCSFYENLKDWCKNLFKNSKKFVYYNEELVTNSKFQTQLSRKLQRFRTCRKNKKCSIFHDLSEYIIFSYGCKLLDWSYNPLPQPKLHPSPKFGPKLRYWKWPKPNKNSNLHTSFLDFPSWLLCIS